ncbi:putative DNA polymerase [Holothuria leucospilota]|uniref:DNA-directed DNA polymerase n=1 Tax=Holothuria leucospilota TaxID=206669 RepID=A0A9Q1BTN1_HOLLE|nr:putative DNA polymerase [Holothuria leucospilota]
MQPLKDGEKCNDASNSFDMVDEAQDEDHSKENKTIFFDFESCVEADGRHVPNLCIAQVVCNSCVDFDDINESCNTCKAHRLREFKFHSVESFCQWACQYPQATFIAHNLKGYDGQFILECFTRLGMCPKELVTTGTKIMYMKRNFIQFKDSYNFIPMALDKFPKTFGLNEEKGFFPYLFNTPENRYFGPWPDVHYYHPEVMSSEKSKAFFKWYEQQRGKLFDMNQEMERYCIDDVNLLRKGCARFRQIFLDMNDMDPFAHAMTIAQACQQVYRRKFLTQETVALVPHHGYRRRDNHSKKAMQWLAWQSQVEGVRINHARNGGDDGMTGFKVDGLQNMTVYEFHGCVWHGCPRCQIDRCKNVPGSNFSMEDAYLKTVKKTKLLRQNRYRVVEMWECDFDRLVAADPKMRAFIKALPYRDPLNPRHAFFGGRTNAICLKYQTKPGEKIKYIDVCSLYPWVNKYGVYPIGHPVIVTENFEPWDRYNGLMYCKVLPPKGLYHPVLPYRNGDKMLFSLCAACAQQKYQTLCKHSDEERALEGTWVTLELQKAMEKGYRMLEIYEVWHFKSFTQYDPETKKGGLFVEYIDTFLKMKQEAEGWPQGCNSEEDRIAYVAEYEAREGVKLEHIEKNEGRRCLAKLMLNSFWGKFGQRDNLPRREILSDMSEFIKLANDVSKETTLNRITEDFIELTWTDKKEFVDTTGTKNVFIAAYTTAQARLKLYSYLECLDDRVLYFDTDSIIYVSRVGTYDPPLGNFLGDMTDELTKPFGEGSYITRFVAGGPKNYSFEVHSSKSDETITQCKVRGGGGGGAF